MAAKSISRPKSGPPPLPIPVATTTPGGNSAPVIAPPKGTSLSPAPTVVPNPTPGAPTVTIPTSSATTVPLPTQKAGAPPLPVRPSPIKIPENVPAVGLSGMAVPVTKTPPKYVTSPDIYEARRDLGQATIDTLRAGANPAAVNEAVQGDRGKKPGGWRGVASSVLNFDVLGRVPGTNIDLPGSFKPVPKLILGPLSTIDTGRRAGVSAFRESVEFARDKKNGKQVYTATDYIPVHPQTGLPIAKVGDPVIANVEKILNTPIPGIEKINTQEQAQAATDKLVSDIKTTMGGSFQDFSRQTKDLTTGFGDIPYLHTGNKWVDRAIGLFGDVALDPVTYMTGPGALFEQGIEKAAGVTAKKTALLAAEDAARSVIVKETEIAAAKLAEKEAAKVATRVAADVTADALAKKAAADALVNAADTTAKVIAEKEAAQVAADAAKQAAKEIPSNIPRVSKAPHRVYGAKSKEALANTIRNLRDDALRVIEEGTIEDVALGATRTATAAERAAAEQAVRILSPELIGEVATNGYAKITGAAAEELGVRGGIRIGLPGFSKVTIPGTEIFTNTIGKAVSNRRLWFVNTSKGAAIANRILPSGAGGLFGEAEISQMRSALRNGTAKGAQATDYVTMLALDKAYRGQLNIIRKVVGSNLVKDVISLPEWKDNAKGLYKYLDVPESEWAAKGLPALTPEQRIVVDAVNNYTDKLYAEANDLATRLGAPALPKLEAYFPHTQSPAALDWASRNGRRVTKIASDLGIDRTTLLSGNYLGRDLREGAVWFGHELTAADVAGGIDRFNEIAKESGRVKFDWFNTDTGEALAKYADNHSRFMAYGESLLQYDTPSISRMTREVTDLTRKVGTKPIDMELNTAEKTILNMMTPAKLEGGWSPAHVQEVIDRLTELDSNFKLKSIDSEDFNQAVISMDQYIKDIDKGLADGTITPAIGSILSDEADQYAISLANQIKNVKGKFAITGPTRWHSVVEQLKDGWVVLNQKMIPNIAVTKEVDAIFHNMSRLDDPKFARYADMLLKDMTTFTKSYVTGSEGFHIRNAMGNTFMMLAGGGKPNELINGLNVYKKWKKALADGKTFEGFIATLPADERKAVTFALAYSGSTGYGQFAEIAAEAGVGKTGISGKAATGLTPFAGRKIPFTGTLLEGLPGEAKRTIPGFQSKALKSASETLYAPLRKLRGLGSGIEESTRFMFLYDGIKQGYSPQEAAARVEKYLMDYQDLSRLDKNMKAIVPFWLWTSRNLPLQVENMWMNPKAYQIYMSFKRNLRDKEGESPFIPDYLKEAGAFKIPGLPTKISTAIAAAAGLGIGAYTGGIPGAAAGLIAGAGTGYASAGPNAYFKPELGFPGAGNQNPLQQLAGGDAYSILSSLTPALRVPVELSSNQQFFSGAPIKKESQSTPEQQQTQLSYALSQLLPSTALLGRYASAVPGLVGKLPKPLVTLTGAKLDKELQTTLGLIGSPSFRLLPAQERTEIQRRYYQLQAMKNRALKNQPK